MLVAPWTCCVSPLLGILFPWPYAIVYKPFPWWDTSSSSFLRKGAWEVNFLRPCRHRLCRHLYVTLIFDLNLSGYRILGWTLFSCRILRALLHCLPSFWCYWEFGVLGPSDSLYMSCYFLSGNSGSSLCLVFWNFMMIVLWVGEFHPLCWIFNEKTNVLQF